MKTRVQALIWVPAVGLIATLCCSATSPSAGSLSIVPDLSTLKRGDQQSFTAMLTSAGSSRPVTAVWRSDAATIVAIDAVGLATARAAGTATISATVGDQTATRALRVVDNLNGGWTGQSVIRECGSSGVGLPCTGTRGSLRPFVLQVQQLQDHLAGTLNTCLFPSGPVAGTVGTDGSFTLTGKNTDQEGTSTLSDWQGHSDPDAGAINGRFTVRSEFVNFFGPQFIWYVCEFNAVRDTK